MFTLATYIKCNNSLRYTVCCFNFKYLCISLHKLNGVFV